MAFKNYCNLRRPLFTALLCLPLLAQSSGYLSVAEAPKVSGKRNETVQAKIPVTVKSGYHVNSNTPSDELLIPLKLTWKSTGSLEAGTITYPKPTVQRFEFQLPKEKPLSVYVGNFEVLANFKVAANAPAGPGMAVGQLRYQACSDKACYPPKNAEVTIPYQVQ